jgi:hypothetical protein
MKTSNLFPCFYTAGQMELTDMPTAMADLEIRTPLKSGECLLGKNNNTEKNYRVTAPSNLYFIFL